MHDYNVQRAKGYPDVIMRLPEAEIQVDGAKAWILQGNANQLVFFEFDSGTQVPKHSHSYDQWGIVIEGEMELVIDGKPRICPKGAEYVIPSGAEHFAKFLHKTRVMDFFSEKNRYKLKPIEQSLKQGQNV